MKRMPCPGLTQRELYLGSIVNVHARQLKLVDYGDLFTRNKFEAQAGRTFALIKPDCYIQTGKIVDAIYKNGFSISKLKMSKFTKPSQADDFYEKHKGAPFFADLTTYMQSDVVTGVELVSPNAIECLRSVLGPTDSAEAKRDAPGSLRAHFGTDVMRNAVHASASSADYQRELGIFFSPQFGPTAAFNNCTCCIIKPHVVQDGLAGQVIDAILQEGFEISSMQMFTLDKPTAEEFFEVYKGVLPEFVGMIEAMTIGPCIVMEVRQENAVESFRQFVGPMDPEIAKNLRPNTLRAKFGHTRTNNGVHCTDLPEDGALEVEYFFSIQ